MCFSESSTKEEQPLQLTEVLICIIRPCKIITCQISTYQMPISTPQVLTLRLSATLLGAIHTADQMMSESVNCVELMLIDATKS